MVNSLATRNQLRQRLEQIAQPVSPDILQPAAMFFDLAGEDIGCRLLLTNGSDGETYCLRPDFTLPIAAHYLSGDAVGEPAAFCYIGPVFRQREHGPLEFDQAGLEFLASRDSDRIFSELLHFAIDACALYGEGNPRLLLGAVDLFETLLEKIDLPDVWRPRIRDRFGRAAAMNRLLDRLALPDRPEMAEILPDDDTDLIAVISARMQAAGLSPWSGRNADEIAARYREKQTLARAAVSLETVNILRAFLAIAGPAREQIARIAALAAEAGISLDAPLALLSDRLNGLQINAAHVDVEFDAGFSPRLDYYTGHVFELKSVETGAVLASGGQYDRLLEQMGASQRISAVGCAIWLDRLEGYGA